MLTTRITSLLKPVVATLLALAASTVLAEARTYRIQTSFDASSTRDSGLLLEMFGKDLSYAALTDFGPTPGIGALLSRSLLPQVEALGHGEIELTYDRQAPVTSVTANGANYAGAASPLSVTLSGAGGSQQFATGSTSLYVGHNSSGSIQSLILRPTRSWLDGPLPGVTFALQAPALPEFGADLRTLLEQSTCCDKQGALAGILGFGSLPVRLTAPTVFGINIADLTLHRAAAPAGAYDNLPVDPLAWPQFDSSVMAVSFTGNFGVRVDAADYSSEADFLAAKSWVDANLLQIDFDLEAQYLITSVAEVPEPATGALMLAGLALLASRARRCRPA